MSVIKGFTRGTRTFNLDTGSARMEPGSSSGIPSACNLHAAGDRVSTVDVAHHPCMWWPFHGALHILFIINVVPSQRILATRMQCECVSLIGRPALA